MENMRPADSPAVLTGVIDYSHLSHYGICHGRVVLELIDRAGGVACARHAGGGVRTVAISDVRFLSAVCLGDVVTATARVDWVGRTSMDVVINVTATPHDGGEYREVASARAVFTAVDAEGKPKPVPPLETHDQAGAERLARVAAWREARRRLDQEYPDAN